MRKIHEVLRLHFDNHLGQRQIARSAAVSQSTVHEYLARFAASGLSWPLPEDVGAQQLEQQLFPAAEACGQKAPTLTYPPPDWPQIERELHSHKYMTLQLVWEEYRQSNPDGYSYSRFCHHYREWKGLQDLVLRQVHRPGERMFVDWAGAKVLLDDPQTGTREQCSVFVAVLGASSYSYAEATRTQQLADWIGAHTRALEFFGGVPELVVPDNAKTGVIRACRYDPDLNPTYQEWARHYGVGVLPARPYKPRDKAKVENGVLVAGRWILAVLRRRQFFSLPHLNQTIRELLVQLNERPFKKQPGSRASRFAELDQPRLRPLPERRFEDDLWARATVNIDYHVAFDHNFYSVPYCLAGKSVDVRATATAIEIFHNGDRVASHVRSREVNQAVTEASHRPKAHQAHQDWPPSRIVDWARKSGPHTALAVDTILQSYPHPEMGYRSCLGLIRMANRYGSDRMEAACERILLTGTVRYRSIKSVLEKQLDRQPLPGQESEPKPSAVSHENVRGAEYFAEGGTR
jgi:transposase